MFWNHAVWAEWHSKHSQKSRCPLQPVQDEEAFHSLAMRKVRPGVDLARKYGDIMVILWDNDGISNQLDINKWRYNGNKMGI